MSQYNRYQSGPSYPPEQGPEEDYYDEVDYEYDDDNEEGQSGSPLMRSGLFFCAGCLVVFACLSCCALAGAGAYLFTSGSPLASTPIPGSDIGLSFETPAYPDESVVNEQNGRVAIIGVNRNAALPAVAPVEGRELIIVTVEMVNLGEDILKYNERDFVLLNNFEESFDAMPGVVDGALGRGELEGGVGLEGRMVFEAPAGELDLVLRWDGGPGTKPRFIFLQ